MQCRSELNYAADDECRDPFKWHELHTLVSLQLYTAHRSASGFTRRTPVRFTQITRVTVRLRLERPPLTLYYGASLRT